MAANGRKNADEALALGVAQGLTLESAATRAGVSPRTAARRSATPEFQRLVARLRTEILTRAVGAIAAVSVEVVIELRTLMRRAAKESVRLGAARTLLEYHFKGSELVTLAGRIDELERMAAGRKGKA